LSTNTEQAPWINFGTKIFALVVFILIARVFWGCAENRSEYLGAKATCIEKGKRYFQQIGSYPHLSDGRAADSVAEERCSNTTGAFDSYDQSAPAPKRNEVKENL